MTNARDRLRLRPMTQEEYDDYRDRSQQEYAQDIADSRQLDLETALEQSAAEFAQLLPDGLASPGMHLWTALSVDTAEPVGLGWLRLRTRSSGVSAWIYDIRVVASDGGRGGAER